ncbi:YSIRK-type signal peptide-containing protein [Streptococcus sp. SPS1]|uniref:YSIRK-type signal peptide-containing protein n=1 Tax=Streptococcus sp. SPS1 TaxID=3018247 RepID=UPI00263EA10C|nr:YSIRK-type signal peptide-containing protein [Streptococcus sp. SPS1]MDN5027378.1 YSIRK-type signal peptide-containing protein [Streptococcus sp. SPS1]
MNHTEKQLKYSIRKVSVGAASVVIGAFYFAMGAGVVHAETNATTEGGTSHSSPSPESNTNNPNSLPGSNYQAEPAPNPATLLAGVAHSVKEETETKTVTRTIKYVDASDESKEVATPVIQTVTLTRKKGTEEWSTEKWEAKTAPPVDGYDVSGNNTVEAKEVTSSTKDETVLVYYSKKESASSNSSSTSETTTTRSRRVRREVGDNTDGGTDETSTGTTVNKKETVVDPKRKGETVQENHPGVNVPKKGEEGADDPNAHLTFKKPGDDATVEEMWKIIQNMPDDFQNNERSYLRNMDTLGDNLRFDENGNVTDNPNGKKLQPGEIREISSFGGWTAIMKKDGETGKFAIGMKNEQGYFTGWYNKNGERQEGGMLGSNALDQIFLHEQALDRRFKYMLMLAKGRTIANKEDEAQDKSEFDIKTANNKFEKDELNKLPVKEKDDKLQHSPNIEGFNGMEKTFKAFSTEYGSRLKIDFVTGYISDYEGSKGTYRIVVKAIKKDNSEETVYDHTINRIDGIVENEERYSQGVDLSVFNQVIKKLLKDEYIKKVNALANPKYKEKYPNDKKIDKDKLDALKEEVKQELAKKGDVTFELPIDKDELHEVEKNGKPTYKFKEGSIFTVPYATVANKLNNSLNKKLDTEVRKNSPIWLVSTETNLDGTVKAKDSDRVYKILDFVLPTAKKIIYHADTDQLELQTDPEKVKTHRAELKKRLEAKVALLETTTKEDDKTKLKKEISALKSAIGSTNSYTYVEARNGSKEAKILGSKMEATEQPSASELAADKYNRIKTNELAAKAEDGLSKFTAYFVEKYKVKRSNVLPDAELSKKITEEIGGDENKLGKGGYFSTGDIPLDKDVVAYKIQVFAENEKRVGVNKQSPRLQYNLPILADFSVIQDTVAPSKEVTKRIITKLKEKGKITEEEEKKNKRKN